MATRSSFLVNFNGYPLAFGVLLGVVLIPLTTRALVLIEQAPGGGAAEVGAIHRAASRHQVERRLQRRLYADAVSRCKPSRALAESDPVCKVYWDGVDRCLASRGIRTRTHCPDINDPVFLEALFGLTLAGYEPVPVPPSVIGMESSEPAMSQSELSGHARGLLRRFVHAGTCPVSLKNYLPGFYDLCNSLVGEGVSRDPITGRLSPNAALQMRRAAELPETTLRTRLKMFEKARPDR